MSSDQLIGVINASIKQNSFSVYAVPGFKQICHITEETIILTPSEDCYELDPADLMSSINVCCEDAVKVLRNAGHNLDNMAGVGITSQSEAIVVWHAVTGKPFHNILLGKDMRAAATAVDIIKKVGGVDKLKEKTGLLVSAYFPAVKIRWLIDNVPSIKEAIKQKQCKVGTLDSWIIWQLTNGALHFTDVTNASRTLLMNLKTLDWDQDLLDIFEIDIDMLPSIRSCSDVYGTITRERSWLHACNIGGLIGNRQASLLGQYCVKPGQVKCTLEPEAFLICNTGEKPIDSKHGLQTTVAYKLGPAAPTCYALEGCISGAGDSLGLFINKMSLLKDNESPEDLADSVPDSDGVYFVPALRGLYAPYWKETARGALVGLKDSTTRNDIIRAAYDSMCFQSNDVLEAMSKDTKSTVEELYVDGESKLPNFLLQQQADTTGVRVKYAQVQNAASLGAAYCVALAKGIGLMTYDAENSFNEQQSYDTFTPITAEEDREEENKKWNRALERSYDWKEPTVSAAYKNKCDKLTQQPSCLCGCFDEE